MDELDTIRKQKTQKLLSKGGATNTPDRPVAATDADFAQTVSKYPLVLVDFWAEWCGPCRMIAPVIDELAKEYKGQVVFAKVNVDQNRQTPMLFNAMSIPTLVLLKNGKEVDRLIGAVPKQYLEALIKPHLG